MNAKNAKWVIVFCSCFLVLPGYVLIYFLGVETNNLFLVLSIICLLIGVLTNGLRLSKEVLLFALIICVFGIVGSLFSGVTSQIYMALCLCLGLLVAWTTWSILSNKVTSDYLTILCLVLVGGAIVAFVYAYAGGGPQLSIELLGRRSYFYISTFTNSVSGNLIRPAGIFDEPGALAMFLTLVVAFNETIRSNLKWSGVVLFLGLITGSMALLVIVLGYILFKFQQRKYLLILSLFGLISGLVLVDESGSKLINERYMERLEVVDGRFSGDNRTHQIESFFRLVNWDITLLGAKAAKAPSFGRVDLSSNPFSIYFGYGVFVWVPYVIIEVWLIFGMFFYKPHLRFPAFAIFATLLQRPYIYNLNWTLMIAIVLMAIYRVQKSPDFPYKITSNWHK